MSMLEKLCDTKDAFEAKALAVLLAAVLAFSMVNIAAFADPAAEGGLPEPASTQVEDASTNAASGNESGANQDANGSEAGQAPSGPDASSPAQNTPTTESPDPSKASGPDASGASNELPTAEPGVAVVGLDFAHAYITYAGQDIALPAKSFNFPLNKELAFTASADTGYEISAVKTVVNGVETELAADGQTGEYKVPADQVTSNLVLKVEGKAPEAAPAAPENPVADPITSSTKIEGEQNPEGEDGSQEGEEPDAGNRPALLGLAPAAAGIPTELTVDPSSLQLNAGDTGALKAVVGPTGSDEGVVWTSSDEKIAQVAADGTVRALAGGTATITARSTVNPALANVAVVTVTEARRVTFWANTGEGEIKGLATPSEVGSAVVMPDLPVGAVKNQPANTVFVGWSTDGGAVSQGGDKHYTNPVFAPGASFVVPSGSGPVKLYAIYSGQSIGAQFYLRVDGQFPAEPQGHNNSGHLSIGWVDGAIKVGKFVTDTTGAAVSANLAATPSDEVIEAVCANSKQLSFDSKTQTVIWYVIKNEGTWHVDGAIRDKASVVLAYNPNIPAGEKLNGDFPNTKAYVVGETVDVVAGNQNWRAGYTFKEWNTAPDGSGTSYQGGYSITLNESTTLYAIWEAKDGTNYRIQDYLQNPDGSWPSDPSHSVTGSGKTGATVHADTTKTYTGYTFDAGNSNNVLSGTVAGDGSLVLKRYYSINDCTVTYAPGDHGAFAEETYQAKFGTATPQFQGQTGSDGKPLGASGYNFAGWEPSVSATVQAETTVYVAQWTKKPVINVLVKSEDKTVVYDGAEHVVSVPAEDLVYEGLPAGYLILNLNASGSGTDAGEYDIAVNGDPTVLDDNDNDVTDQFVIARDKNKLTVQPAPLTVTAPTKEKVYDGTPLTFGLSDIVDENLVKGLVPGQQLVGIDVFGSITDVGSVESSVLGAVVVEGTKNVTRNYDITYMTGTLTVNEYADPIVVTTVGGTHVYDGQPHGATVNVSGLPKGYTLVTAASNASATDVTVAPVKATVDTLRIVNAAGVDVTQRLNMKKREVGEIIVTPATVQVKTNSATQVYNGKPLTAGGSMTGLVSGETATFAVTGTVTDVNAPTGTPNTYRIDWNGSAKQTNYTVVESIGTLTVTEFAGEVTATTVGGEFVYNGKPHTAVVKVDGLPEGYSVSVAASNASATDVTATPVTATVDQLVIRNASGEDVTSKLNIKKIPGSIVVKPAPLTVRIVGNSAVETYTGSVFSVDGFVIETAIAGKATVALKDGASAHAEGTDAGTYSMGLTADSFAVTSRNYQVTLDVVDGYLRIAPLNTLDVAATPVRTLYDGASHGIAAEPSVKDGRAIVKYFNEATKAFDLASSPTFKDAGTYTVRFQAIHPNYGNVAEGSATVTIDERAVTLRSASASRQYDGTPLVAPTVAVEDDGFVAGEEPAIDVTGSATNVADTRDGNNVFNYTFPSGVRAENYRVTLAFGTLAITPAPLTVTVTGNRSTVPFDGNLHEVNGFTDDAAGKAAISLKPGAAAHAEGTDAGTYHMGLTSGSFDVQAPNHTVTLVVKDGLLTIDPANTMSVSADNVSVTYDGTRYGVQARPSVAGAEVRYRDPVTGDYTLKDSPTFLDATNGAQAVEFRATHPNYGTAYGSATVTIAQRQVVLRSADASREYDGTPLVKHEASVEQGSFVAGEEPTLDFHGSATNVADTRVGNNEFGYAFPSGVRAENYQVTLAFGTLAITPAPLTVTVTGAFDNVEYDGGNHVVEGFRVGDEAAGKATVKLKDGRTARVEGVDAGRYPMGLAADAFDVQSDNYRVTLSVVDGYLNIDPAGTMSVDALPVVKTYDGLGYGVEAQASVGGAQIKYYNDATGSYDLDESPKFADAGTYVVKFQATRANYDTAAGQATVTINPRAITLTSADGSKQYDGRALTAETVVVGGDGFAAGEGATFSGFASLTEAGTTPNQFSYRLNAGTKAANYQVKVVYGTLEVEKAPIVVRVQGAVKSVTYNGALQTVDGYTVLDDIAGKATIALANGAAAHAEGVDEGSYAMGLDAGSFSVTSRNYQVTLQVADGKLVIGPSGMLTVAAEPVRAMYDGARHGVAPTTSLPGAKISYWSEESGDYTLDATPTFLDVTSGAQVVKFKATLPNHRDAYGSTTVEVTPRPVSVASADDEKTYDGTPLTNDAITVGGYGFVGGETPVFTVTGSQTDAGQTANAFAYAFPSGARADNYLVTKVEGALTVRKAPLTVTVKGNHETVTFDGSPHSVDGFSDDAAGKATVSLKDGASAHAEGTDAGTYSMGLTADSFTVASQNYEVTLNVVDGYLVVNPAGVMTVEAESVAKIYDGARSGVRAKASVDGAEIKYFNEATQEFDLDEPPTFLDATEGPRVVRFAATHPNYATVEGSATVTISRRAVVLTSGSADKTYDGETLSAAHATVSGEGFAAGEGASYSDFASIVDAGTVPNEFAYQLDEGTHAGNYDVTVVYGTLSVAKAPLAVTVVGNRHAAVYDGSPHAAEGFVVDAGGKAAITLKEGALARVEGTDAGTHPMGLTADSFVAESKNYEVALTVVDGSLSIAPATLLIKANDASKAYGQEDPELTASVSGLAKGDVFAGSYDVARTFGESVGSYPVLVENAVSGDPNYTVQTAPGTFAITAAQGATIVVNGDTKVYDGTPLLPGGFSATGLAEGDVVEVTLAGAQTDAGSSEAGVEGFVVRNAAGEDVTANYADVTVVPGTLTVTPAAATIVVADAAKLVGEADPAFTGTVAGLVDAGDLGAVAYSRTRADEAVGTYPDAITATYTDNPNYAVTVVPGTFTIVALADPSDPVTLTPGTIDAPGGPGTPPGTVPDSPLEPVLTPVVEVLQDAVTPLAGPQEEVIDDNGNPLAGFDRVNCWVHHYLILGILVTLIYGACVLVRRINFTRKLKGFEDDVLGIEDESATAPGAIPQAADGGKA